tara:strand:+ start:1107 stop:1835 length:729 start_codon:yes stop_codon:yes gene_type:complete
MILRRLTKHVRDENWFAVGLDFVIVVIGVFVGMQVSNWNDAHQTQSERQLVETRLLSDFVLMHEDVVRAAEGHEAVLESLHTLRDAIERGEALPEEDSAIKHALGRGFSYQSSIHRSGTFLELLSSGRMDLISNEALRVELLRYDTRAQRVLFNLNQIRNYMHSNMPNLNAYKVSAPLTRDERGRIILSPVQSYDIQGMAVDANFRDALDLMIENQTWVQTNVTGQVDALEDVLTVLQDVAP